MYSVEFLPDLGVLNYGSSIAAAGDFLDGSFFGRSGTGGKRPVRQAARVAGFCIGLTSVGSRAEDRRICRRSTVIASASAATGRAAASGSHRPRCGFSAARSTCMPWSSWSRPCGKGRPRGASASCPSCSASTGAPSPAGRSSGRSTFRRPRSGRSRAASCCPLVDAAVAAPGVAAAFLHGHDSDPTPGLGAAAGVSLADHDHGGLGERDFALAFRRPQKMRVDGTGRAELRWSRSGSQVFLSPSEEL